LSIHVLPIGCSSAGTAASKNELRKTRMIYTIGLKETYDISTRDSKHNPAYKLGPSRDDLYPGGFAFPNLLAAYDYIYHNKNYWNKYDVYRMVGSWKKDVYWNEKEGLFLINKNLKLVPL
jgi:hypothetical protein